MMRQFIRRISRWPTAVLASLHSSHRVVPPSSAVGRFKNTLWRNARVVLLVMGTLASLSGPAQADVHRFFSGQHPAGAANPSLCTDQAEPWYPTVAEACQGIKSVLPACDRSSAIYRNYVATLAGPGLCSVSWEYANVSNPGVWNSFGASYGVTTQSCPGNSTQTGASCICDAGFVTDPQNPSSCVQVINAINLNKASSPDSCKKNPGVGNPIYPLTGAKTEYVDTGVGLGGLNLSLIYDTTLKVPANQADTASAMAGPNSFGALWKSSFHHRLVVAPGATRALLSRGDGKILNFTGNGAGIFTTDADNSHKLVSIAGGYRFTDAATGDQETFDSAGLLQSLARGSGMVLSFVHSGANLTKVQSSDGRAVRFSYTSNLISKITDANGRTIVPAYDANRNLVSLTWQDGKVNQFLYENTSFPWAMTGKVDENNARYATFTYDAQGRATSSEHAGGVGRYSVSYTQPPQLVVTDTFNAATRVLSRQHDWQMPGGTTLELPNGQSSSIAASSVMGQPSVTSQSQPAGSGCAAAASTMSYDANGNIASLDDFTQMRSCYANDPGRNLPVVTVEGLANTADCATVLAAGAGLPAGSRKVSTRWHPDWNLATRVEQPLKITTNIYHGQPDPFNSGLVANCTSAPNLPNGKPLPVLCKRIEQATLDVDGASASPYDLHYDSVSLLLRGDGADGSTSVVDSSAAPKAVTVAGNARISTAQSKFGGSSLYFDGSRDYVSLPSHPSLSMGASDFTVEMWIYKIANNANTSRLWNPDGDFVTGVYLTIAPDGNLVSAGSSNGTSFNAWNGSGVFIPNGVWKHVALVRLGGTVTLYVDGAATVLTTTLGATALYDSGRVNVIGGQGAGADRAFNGYIDEVRITKGLARYTGAFTPPTAAHAGPVAPGSQRPGKGVALHL
jgi:YD repeat-containing protein